MCWSAAGGHEAKMMSNILPSSRASQKYFVYSAAVWNLFLAVDDLCYVSAPSLRAALWFLLTRQILDLEIEREHIWTQQQPTSVQVVLDALSWDLSFRFIASAAIGCYWENNWSVHQALKMRFSETQSLSPLISLANARSGEQADKRVVRWVSLLEKNRLTAQCL